jgi:hypothetical protein
MSVPRYEPGSFMALPTELSTTENKYLKIGESSLNCEENDWTGLSFLIDKESSTRT